MKTVTRTSLDALALAASIVAENPVAVVERTVASSTRRATTCRLGH